MTIIRAILLACCLGITAAKAQRIQPGLSAGLNSTFFHRAGSSFDEEYTNRPMPRFGIAIPVYVRLCGNWTFRTGIGFQVKEYRIRQKMEPLPGTRAIVRYSARFNVGEIPLLVGYVKANAEKKYCLEYTAGCVLTFNSPVADRLRYRVETDRPFTSGYILPDAGWERTFSPDLYASVSAVKFRENKKRRQQITLSYQYGLRPTARFEYTTYVEASAIRKENHTVAKPSLSCLALTYTLFPGFRELLRRKS